MTKRPTLLASLLTLFTAVGTARADDAPTSPSPDEKTGVQLDFHYGVLQPILLRGFNAAVDVRGRRWMLSYSHGQGLEFSRAPGALTKQEEAAGVRIVAPISTGGGVGYRLWRELYVMADVKVHRFEVAASREVSRYTTVTVGAEVGYRIFLYKGLHITPVVRFWPNVWDNAPSGGVEVATADGSLRHEPLKQGSNGVFANVLVGWAFDL
ncbi:MAG: hypothetical protein SFX73_09815 [Kofleriaceae bacterium]|nr:hypothetical protein [Kofleriaceae bacterium]